MKNFVPATWAIMACLTLMFVPLTDAKAQVTKVDPQTAAQLQFKLDDIATVYNLKGLSASVIIPGKGTWNGASGISHAFVPIDTAMAFGFASISHNLTAAGILLLQQDNLLSLSDSLHAFLPTFPNINPNITIRQLLQHTSGLFDYYAHPGWYNSINSSPAQPILPQVILNNYVSAPLAAPGATHNFCNTNYLLLGLIIEQVSAQSYASFIRQRLLNPLQLTSVYAMEHELPIGVMAHHWSPSGPAVPPTDLTSTPLTAILGTTAASAGFFGTAYDLARWGQFLFTGPVLSSASLQQMKQFMTVNIGTITGYGLGLQRYGMGNAQIWGYSGNIRGFSSGLIFSPADNIVVGISSNQPLNGHTLAYELLVEARQQLGASAPNETEAGLDGLACFPNPVQMKGRIAYRLRKAQPVTITLHNSLGQKVKTVFSQPQPAGKHSLTVDTSNLPSGAYFCTMQTAERKLVKRWVVSQ